MACEGALPAVGEAGRRSAKGNELFMMRRPIDRSDGTAQTCVVITVDTEPDDAWTNHQNPSVRNVRELLRLQRLLDEFGAKATLLVTYRVIEDGGAMAVLERLVSESGAEVGAHLHPWETPPFLESGLDTRYPTYPHELPLSLFEDKMAILTERITARFGRPTSYRAGRWGLVAEHLPVLERLGYQVDTSVTPLIDWRSKLGIPRSEGGRGGVDYRRAPHQPYHPSYHDVTRPGEARIVEWPVSVGFTRLTPDAVRRAYGGIPVLVQRVLRRTEIMRPVWAIPPEHSSERLVRMAANELRREPATLNIAFHSSELMVDGSPRSRTRELVDRTFVRIEGLLRMLSSNGCCQFPTLADATRSCAVIAAATTRRPGPPCDSQDRLPQGPLHASNSRVRDLVYILSPSYSGSTLLTFLLGTHPHIATIGELKATAMGDVDKYVCSCGALIRQCPFWRRVTAELSRHGVQFDVSDFGTHFAAHAHWLADRLLRARVRGPAFELARTVGIQLQPRCRSTVRRVLEKNQALIEVITKIQRGRLFLDASKDPVRLKHLLESRYWNIKVIHLIRDGRGTSYSYMRHHKAPMAKAARAWHLHQTECDRMIGRLPQNSSIKVHYEHLCVDRKRELARIFRCLRVDPSEWVRDFRSNEHHILGNNPMRLAPTAAVVLDERWRAALTPQELRVFDAVAGKLNRVYGYE